MTQNVDSFSKKEAFNITQKTDYDSYERRFKSPVFSFSNTGTLAQNEGLVIDYAEQKPEMRKYGSFNFIRISNYSSSEVLLYPNQNPDQALSIPSGSSTVIDESTVSGTNSLKIVVAGSSSVTANQIRIEVWKDKTDVQNIASQLHRRFFGKKNFSDSLLNIFNAQTNKDFGSVI